MAASWVLAHSPWSQVARARLKALPWSKHYMATSSQASKVLFNSSFLPSDHPTMLEMRQRPYPSDGWDTSLFEDPTEDTLATESEYQAHRPCQTLAQLVREGRFAEAAAIRQELHEMGVVIAADAVYAHIAVDQALHPKRTGALDRIRSFMNWWCLVPRPDSDDNLWKKRCLRDDFLATCRFPDAQQVVSTVLHVTHEGHPRVAAILFFPYIIPKSPVTFILALLSNMCAASLAHGPDVAPHSAKPAPHIDMCQALYSWVVRHFCALKRLEDALIVLKHARDRGLSVKESAYKSLIRQAVRTQDAAAAKYVKECWGKQEGTRPHVLSVPPISTSTEVDQALVMQEDHGGDDEIPPLDHLYPFIRQCHSVGNHAALNALRTRCIASSRSRQLIPRFATEEMRYFMQQSQKAAVLATFDKHFSMVGTPSAELSLRIVSVKARLQRFGSATASAAPQHPRPEAGIRSEHYIPEYLLDSSPILTKKLIPTRHHNIFVWTALARLADRETLTELYKELIRLVQREVDRDSRSQSPTSATLSDDPHDEHDVADLDSQPQPSKFLLLREPQPFFDVVHFNTFIRAFALRREYRQACTVLADMLRLRLSPDLETYTTLIAALTKSQHLRYVIIALNLAEHDRLTHTPGYRGIARTKDALESPRSAQVLILTTSALTAYLDRGDLASAQCMRRRIIARLSYEPGSNPITDSALRRYDVMRESRSQTKPTMTEPRVALP